MEAKIGLDLETLRNTTTHQSFQPSSTQEDFYRKNGSPEDILLYTRPSCSIGPYSEN